MDKQEEVDRRMIKMKILHAQEHKMIEEIIYQAIKIAKNSPELSIASIIIMADEGDWIKD
ncbi:MAG TPA: hypothetical protein ENH06_00600 [bacterium]|nr:hypothetical protein [bacterium]